MGVTVNALGPEPRGGMRAPSADVCISAYMRVPASGADAAVSRGGGLGDSDEPARRPKPKRRVRTTVSVFCQCPALICMPEEA